MSVAETFELPGGPAPFGAPSRYAAGQPSPSADPVEASTPSLRPGRLADALLLIYADALDDLERVRIATQNRVRALRQAKGMDDTPEERRLAALVEQLTALEHGAELELKRALRKHPLGPWVKGTVGVGEKQGARLLAAIGDPYLRPDGTPRTVSALWAYCGYHVLHPGRFVGDAQVPHAGVDPSSDLGRFAADAHDTPAGVAPRRQKGQRANWNGTAKMRAHLIAESCIKQAASPYRTVYDARRLRTAATHPEWTPGHSHNDALRIVSKAVLRDLWREAKRLHEVES